MSLTLNDSILTTQQVIMEYLLCARSSRHGYREERKTKFLPLGISFRMQGRGEQLTIKETVASGSESCMGNVILY